MGNVAQDEKAGQEKRIPKMEKGGGVVVTVIGNWRGGGPLP